MKRPTMSQPEVDEMIRWAVREQAALGLKTVTDGEGYRENMYYFYRSASMAFRWRTWFGNRSGPRVSRSNARG
jgi:hypothetical protein